MRSLLIACLTVFCSISIYAQSVTREFDVSDFSKVDVSSGFDVNISQGDNEFVSVKLDKDLEKYLIVENENNGLKIYLKKKSFFQTFSRREVLKVDIVVKDLNKVNVSGGGDAFVKVRDLLNISVSGGGDVTCYGKPSQVIKKLSGGSELKIIR